MTVVACTRTEMAADSLCCAGSAHWFTTKLYRISDGSIAGVAGNGGEAVVAWLNRGSPADDKPCIEGTDFFVLHLKMDSSINLYCNSLLPDPVKGDNHAIGCGSSVALYAMRKLNMSPAQACQASIEVNHFCGGDIDVMRL